MMNKGIKTRLIIHEILCEIKKNNINFDSQTIQNKINIFSEKDRSFINNVCLNSMRRYFFVKKIINKYLRKESNFSQEILLLSAVTQIVFLKFKEYAVIDCSVSLAKKIRVNPGLINATLKNINRDKENLSNIRMKFSDLPNWFQRKAKNLTISEKKLFVDNFYQEPNLHLVFKNKEKMETFEEKIFYTSSNSAFLLERKKLQNIKSFKYGNWWVQDFSSSWPISNLNYNFKDKKIIDLCSAPGGKSFQILSKKISLTLNDKSKFRLKNLNENLKRLNFKAKILNLDLLNTNLKEKYDFIILDSPCSSIGTIRKNPEILFKTSAPDMLGLIKLQKGLLNKASTFLNKKGVILYMVCSFLKEETTEQVDNFLKRNKNFTLDLCAFKNSSEYAKNFLKNKYMNTLPKKIDKFNIDGYFAACLIKNN